MSICVLSTRHYYILLYYIDCAFIFIIINVAIEIVTYIVVVYKINVGGHTCAAVPNIN